MRALVLNQPGPVTSLNICEMPEPHPESGQLRVSVEAVGLNPVEYKLAGRGNPSRKIPPNLGLDVAGVIDEIGDGGEQWKVGDRIFYHGDLTQPGGFADYAITSARRKRPKKDTQSTTKIPPSVRE